MFNNTTMVPDICVQPLQLRLLVLLSEWQQQQDGIVSTLH